MCNSKFLIISPGCITWAKHPFVVTTLREQRYQKLQSDTFNCPKIVIQSILLVQAHRFSQKLKELLIKAIWCRGIRGNLIEKRWKQSGVVPLPWRTVNDYIPGTYMGNVRQLKIPFHCSRVKLRFSVIIFRVINFMLYRPRKTLGVERENAPWVLLHLLPQ